MSAPPRLPLPADQLPEKIRRFGDPAAPKAARSMAARGLVPIQGANLLMLLTQLAADPDEEIASAANGSLTKMPPQVIVPACQAELHPSAVDSLADIFRKKDDVLEALVLNAGMTDHTLERVARAASESIGELIATNQERLLRAPEIVEALYKNKNVRMSTADRLIELCARNGVELTGIPAFQAHAEAIKGQLIPEPSDEPLPSDIAFQEAAAEGADEDAFDIDIVEKTEEVKDKFKPLSFRIQQMTIAEKIRLTTVGNAAARGMLVRDPNRLVSHAAISSASMSAAEATGIAYSRNVSDDILRYIGNRKEWLRSYEIKRALVTNPKTPIGISLRFLGHLRANDLKALSRSRGIPGPLKTAAKNRMQKKEGK